MARRFYQTTPIYYVNDRPHLGTAYTMVNADALARWHRMLGDDVHFLTGTDEHGLKIARAAAERGVSPKEWADRTSELFRSAWQALSISNDDFIRTTEPRHRTSVRRFMQAIHDNGHIYLGEYAGWYCVACEVYYPEAELAEGRTCPVHAKPVEWLVEENYFFRLSAFSERLLDWLGRDPAPVRPEVRSNEAASYVRHGLEDISITRTSIDWGIPVPWDDAHVVYVWYDALVNYITAIGYGSDEERFRSWWPASHHLIGKDILRFHCVWWPAMCMAAGIDPPAEVFVHGFLTVGGEKMSKTRANQIDPLELASDVGVEPLRYHLLREVSLGADGDFSYESLLARYNADLANNLGNLLARVTTLVAQKLGGVGPAPGERSVVRSAFEQGIGDIRAAWGASQPQLALERTWALIGAANAELEASEPWKLPPGPELEDVLGDALEALRLVAILAAPAMPAAAATIWSRIGLPGAPDEPGRAAPDGDLAWGRYPGGLAVLKGAPLFPRRRTEEPGASVGVP